MKIIPDLAARLTALTAVDRTLLVEAGAGSGKTSIMAGRVAVLFARGVAPKSIAAITFTEFAASELRLRIEKFTMALANGEVPRDLAQAFPGGVPEAEKANIYRAYQSFDQLTCSTIHGFAQALIKPYPAEAGIDPGADIVDPTEADLAFRERYDAWLKGRLSGDAGDGLVAQIILANETGGLKLIEEVVQFLRKNRDASCARTAWSSRIMGDFAKAAEQFETDLRGYAYAEEKTAAACRALRVLADLLSGSGLAEPAPSNAALIAALDFERDESCFTQAGGRRVLQTKTKWQDAAAKAGLSKASGTAAFDAVLPRYSACHDALEVLLGAVAGELLGRLCEEARGLLEDWRDYKRSAALLDFDDLLYTARDLLRDHEPVRQALSQRFQHVMVDEFQDTDPLQTEILWLICGDDCAGSDALARPLRHGSLFMVGDPKQAIYRFRGADVNAYIAARSAVEAGSQIKITANFRSVEPILDFVNTRFEPALSAAGQPGFSELSPIHPAIGGRPGVCALDVVVDGEKPKAAAIRDAEAVAVAGLCDRMVGNLEVRDHRTGEMRPCRFGDIALLAPVGTELWRFEEALEDLAIPVSTQAGKGFFRRQEIQDLIALTRALADSRDTLAFGSLLRGPLVGLSETDLLDISEALPSDPDRQGLPMLTIRTDPGSVTHALAKDVLAKLSSLRKRVRTTTPYALLADAIAALHVRAQIRQRFKAGAERAVANVDLFLDMARAYDVRGLRAFASDMRANWEEAVRQVEGRPDAEQEAVSLITVHAAKGLEWPIVIPINMTGTPKAESGLVQDRSKNLFSIPILGVCPADHGDLEARADEEQRRERVRLWYVAATRARDLLVLPRHSAGLSDKCWAKLVDLDVASLPAIKPEDVGAVKERNIAHRENGQTREAFAAEATAIFDARRTVVWHRPSRSEVGEAGEGDVKIQSGDLPESAILEPAAVLGSSTRGTVLHKLVEEVLTGETSDARADLETRAAELVRQVGQEPAADPKDGISAIELASTVLRTLALPDVATLRPRLVPELPLFGAQTHEGREILLSGQVDAIAFDDTGAIDAVVDWKSDVAPDASSIGHYRQQIADYRKQTKAKRGLLVFMTTGQVVDVA
ncbi:ATP-dependent exoDNAse (exonuclease V) beta subunit [Bradyrhizobium sp. R2.2-H]|jgi:ATP-dependent exoDNAse (exonuclease V) beta subunit|uniref:UvrD-helicase domain-containing protein n=1 Tax=unclassified Bradyrhizobium TaxID=2631580 RepID=UPI0010443F92|nr:MULTISPECIES: UvrD-helicase domain-containing protein [unclassified Bradyrhizobium]TCU63740.1 ATP-dependent exoDNAse (exonuclease V) beta subunit [Bradyrhizobium sp. Y-H1]TCU65748.1 ATP-dependent exoDNAse (exonuclease V) beta subunit [Bradyrhizobium sp. R2.2-H]